MLYDEVKLFGTTLTYSAKVNDKKKVENVSKYRMIVYELWHEMEGSKRGAGAQRGDGDGWTELTVRYSSCTLERTSC